jgi:membrane protein
MILKKRFNLQYFTFLIVYLLLILFAFNIESVLDFVNVSIMYLPLYFIITVSNYNTKINDIGMIEIEYMQNRNKFLNYFKNVILDFLSIALIIFVNLGLYTVFYGGNFNSGVSIFDYILNAYASILLFVGLTYFVSTLTFSKSITIFICSIFWIYFMINIDSTSILNPFFYVGDPNSSSMYLYTQNIISIVLLFLTGYLKSKSPYFLESIRRF